MSIRKKARAMAMLVVAAIASCRGSDCDAIIVINGYPPPNSPPRASRVELPDQVMTVGQELTVSGVESLFLDDDLLTLTAASSDTTVVAVSLARNNEYSFSLTLNALSPGAAEVSIVATEPAGDGSQDDQQPSGRSATREINVTVVESSAQNARDRVR